MLHAKLSAGFCPAYTVIPNVFIDSYMNAENPVFVLVYMLFYRHCVCGRGEISIEQAADALQILESDVVKALRYWRKAGLIALREDGSCLSVEFLPVGEPSATGGVSQDEMPSPEPEAAAQEPDNVVSLKTRPIFLMERRPSYTPEELDMYRSESGDIKRLFAAAEQALGKLLTYNDMNALFGMYDWLRLPTAVIELLLCYAADNGRSNMRYVEKVALDWAENGITTVEAAKAYIHTYNVEYREILKAFGQSRRDPTPSEIKYIKKWRGELDMPLNAILEACDKTIMQTGQSKFQYADKILTQWNSEGIKTLDAIKEREERFYAEKEAKDDSKKAAKKAKPGGTNRFVNFKQREWNYDEIEKKAQQKLKSITSE